MNKVELAKIIGLKYEGWDNGTIVDKYDISDLKESQWNFIEKCFSSNITIQLNVQDVKNMFDLDIMKDEVTPEQLSQLIWELAADKYFEKLNSVIDKFN